MKKMGLFFVLFLLVIVVLVGCSNNQQSSKEEAQFVVRSLPDFQEQLLYFSVSVRAIGPVNDPFVQISEPKVFQTDKTNIIKFVHEILYRTMDGKFKLILLNDERPPQITATKEFKFK